MDAIAMKQILEEILDKTFDRIKNRADALDTNMRESLDQAQEINQTLDNILATSTQVPSLANTALAQGSTNGDNALEQASGKGDATGQDLAKGDVPDMECINENINTAIDLAVFTKILQEGAAFLLDWHKEKFVKKKKTRMVVLAHILDSAAKALQLDLQGAQVSLDTIEKDAEQDTALKAWQGQDNRQRQEEGKVETQQEREKAQQEREKEEDEREGEGCEEGAKECGEEGEEEREQEGGS